MKPILIGIAGPKRSGKDTTAQLLRHCLAAYDENVLIGQASFADILYEMIGCLVGHDKVEQLRHSDDKDTEIIEPYGVTLRQLVDTLGTEWGRDLIHPDVWVMAMYQKIQRAATRDAQGEPVVVLIPDVRFPNEAELIRNNGFLIHLQREGDKHQSDHRSAVPLEVEDTDSVFQNNGTLAQFEEKVTSYGRSTFFDDITAVIRASKGVGRLLSE